MAAPRAAELARQGVRHFEQADYTAAEQAFSAARQLEPDDPRHAFQLGCALASQQRWDDALGWFQLAAQASDPELAARSQFNLAGVLVAQARGQLTDPPEQLPEAKRQNVVGRLEQAIDAYRSCLRLSPDQEQAATHIERLRLWLQRMREAWRQFDLQQQREQLDLLNLLETLRRQQAELGHESRQWDRQWPSPRRRQAIFEATDRQLDLARQLDGLPPKLSDALLAGDDGVAPGSSPQPTSENVRRWVDQRIADCRRQMQQAARHLDRAELRPAELSQVEALDTLDELYGAFAPFERLLPAAIEKQAALVETTEQQLVPLAADAMPGTSSKHDGLTRGQDRIAPWARALWEEANLRLLDQPADGSDVDPLAGAWQKAVALCPEIETLSQTAADHLRREDWSLAQPAQQRALELLREIARQMPPPDKDSQSQDSSQNQNADPNQQPQDSQSSQPDSQPPPDSERSPGEESADEQPPTEPGEQPQAENPSEPGRQPGDAPRPPDASQESADPAEEAGQRAAEAALRRVRERQREYEQLQRQLRQLQRRDFEGRRDW